MKEKTQFALGYDFDTTSIFKEIGFDDTTSGKLDAKEGAHTIRIMGLPLGILNNNIGGSIYIRPSLCEEGFIATLIDTTNIINSDHNIQPFVAFKMQRPDGSSFNIKDAIAFLQTHNIFQFVPDYSEN